MELLRAEWNRQHHSAAVADALAWALHRSGDSQSALEYAQQAAATGGRTALYAYHLGMIEQRLKKYGQAGRHLKEALSLNPHFNPLSAPKAQKALQALDDEGRPPQATRRRGPRPRPHRHPAAADGGSTRGGVPDRSGSPPRRTSRWAQRLPRFSCSRSIASKRALKLPLPKPIEPWRSIISKKTVGRSWTGFVKICSR